MLTLAFAVGEAPALATSRKVNEWSDDSGEVVAQAFCSADHCRIDWPGVGVFAFVGDSNEVRVWPALGAPHETVTETFSRVLRPIILQALGLQALHAGAAISPVGAVAFCGRKGCGKSTL